MSPLRLITNSPVPISGVFSSNLIVFNTFDISLSDHALVRAGARTCSLRQSSGSGPSGSGFGGTGSESRIGQFGSGAGLGRSGVDICGQKAAAEVGGCTDVILGVSGPTCTQ